MNVAKKVIWLREKKKIISTFTDLEVKKMLEYWKFSSYLHGRNRFTLWGSEEKKELFQYLHI